MIQRKFYTEKIKLVNKLADQLELVTFTANQLAKLEADAACPQDVEMFTTLANNLQIMALQIRSEVEAIQCLADCELPSSAKHFRA